MKEGENEQKGFPVDTGVIKDFLIIIQQFLTLYVMLWFTLPLILGVHLIKSQCHLAKRHH